MNARITASIGLLFALFSSSALAADAALMRSVDLANTGNAGPQPGFLPAFMKRLEVVTEYPTAGAVDTTPAVTADGFLVTGDAAGNLYVVDTADGTELAHLDLGAPVAAAPFIGTVGTSMGGRQRAYVTVLDAENTLWCVDLDSVRDGSAEVLCDGWPKSLAGPTGSATFDGTPVLSVGQEIAVPDGGIVLRDVIFTPTTGDSCSEAGFRAIDADSGEIYWEWDPVPSGVGGRIASVPALNADRTLVYVTTGHCAEASAEIVGHAGSLVALDATSGSVVWFHKRRLADVLGIETTSGVLVADVHEFEGCRVIVNSDADGCVYGFPQEAEIPAQGEDGFDLLRPDQQRLLWRRCLVPGGPDAGFGSSNMALTSRYAVQQTTGTFPAHVGLDDANTFAIDVCAGRVEWISSDVGNGRSDAVIASEMLFQVVATRSDADDFVPELQVTEVVTEPAFRMSPEVYATVPLPHSPGQGGGGPAIAGGRIYVPTANGIVVIALGSQVVAPPKTHGMNLFLGPYPLPVVPAPEGGVELDPETTLPFPVDKTLEEHQAYRS